MSKPKLEMLAPVEPDAAPPDHASVPNTFGRDAVRRAEYLTGNILLKDYLDQEVAYGFQNEAEVQPENSATTAQLGKLATEPQTEDGLQEVEQYREKRRSMVKKEAETFGGWVEEDRKEVSGLLAQTRDRLRNLSPEQQQTFNRYVGFSMPRFLQDVGMQKAADEIFTHKKLNEMPTWHGWFSEEATDDQLLNFLQWHVHSLDEQQSGSEIKGSIERHKALFKHYVTLGISQGWLHPDAGSALTAVEDVKVLVGDEFDTIMQDRGGYHVWGSKEVVIAQGWGFSQRESDLGLRRSMDHALKHEWNHAVLSGGNGNLSRWFEEPMTEHCAEVFDDGKPDVFNPHDRPSRGVYIEERALVDALANFGDVNVPARLFTRFYSAKTTESRIQAFTELKQGLKAAWGTESVYNDVTAAIYEYEEEALQDGKTQREAEKIALKRVKSDLLQQPEVIFGTSKELVSA